MRSNPLSRPVLIHEISSCEPCYSWNIAHSWQLRERERFLEGVYSLFAGAISQQTYSACEHRHGIQSTQCPTYFGFYLARLGVIDDEIADGELHLLRLCPVAWFNSEKETVFEHMPTLYGDINLRFRPTPDGKQLIISFSGTWRRARPSVIVHLPPIPFTKILINGKTYSPQQQIAL